MKMFIWNDPYPVRYGSSLAFAVAETVEEAREKLKKAPAYSYGEFGQATPRTDLGEPIRILDLFEAAEWHEWSE